MPTNEKSNQSDAKENDQSLGEIKLELLEKTYERVNNLRWDLRNEFDNKVCKYRDELSAKVRRYGKWALLIIGIVFGGGILIIYIQSLFFVSKQVSDRLDREFETERIGALVEKKAEEYTEKRVQDYISKTVNDSINPLTNRLGNLITLIELENHARFGSRSAYGKLLKISSEESNLQQMTEQMITGIERDLSIYFRAILPVSIPVVLWDKDGKKTPLEDHTTEYLFSGLESSKNSNEFKKDIMSYIVEKPKKEILPEAFRTLTKSDSLPAAAAICTILAELLDKEPKFLDFEYWTNVCQEELEKYK